MNLDDSPVEPSPADPTVGLMIRKNLKTGGREFVAPMDRQVCWELIGYAIECLVKRALKEELTQGILPAVGPLPPFPGGV